MEQLLNALRRFGFGRLIALLGVGAGVAAALVALTMNLGSQPQSLLYSNLDLKEASSITAALDQAGIKYEAKGDGSTIMVPRDKVASTRLLLSGKGLPTSASVGYEIFDSTNAMGQTDFVQQLNRQRAVEGELARTIHALDGVSFVRVHLVLPKRQLFEEDSEQPSASVTIGVGGHIPSADMVQAVQNLVAGAVPNLKAERVTVIDQHGKTLSTGADGGMGGKIADDRRSEVEGRIQKTVQDLVEGIVGPGKVRVDVTTQLDLSHVTVQEEKYDPDGQVVVSEQTTGENEKQNQPDTAAGVSAAGNLPATPPAANTSNNSSATDRNASTTNYANSKTVRTEVQEPGQIKKLSVAVAVDGVTGPPTKDGKPGPYTARTPEEIQHIKDLVQAAVGFDATRGDVVQVINVPFPHDADMEGVTASSALAGFDKNDIMRAAELVVLAIVAMLILLFAVRPLLRSVGSGGSFPMLAGPGGPSTVRTVAGPDGQPLHVTVDSVTGESLALPPPEIDARIDIARIEGQVKASSIKRVSEFVERHPEESVSILRGWLHETT